MFDGNRCEVCSGDIIDRLKYSGHDASNFTDASKIPVENCDDVE